MIISTRSAEAKNRTQVTLHNSGVFTEYRMGFRLLRTPLAGLKNTMAEL